MTAAASANGHRPGPPRQAVDWGAADYQRDPRTPVLACCRQGCGAKYLDDDSGRVAHVAVFGHSPRPAEAARPAESTEGETP